MPEPIASWNPARGAWEVPQTENLFCEHLGLFSETWPTSGLMLRGQVYALPTSGHPTTDTGSFSPPGHLPTPTVADSRATANFKPDGTPYGDGYGMTLVDAVRTLPTPRTSDANGGGSTVTEGSICEPPSQRLFRTPTAQLAVNGGSQHPDKRRAGGHGPTLADEVEHLIP